MDVAHLAAGNVDLGLERRVVRHQGDELFAGLHDGAGRNLGDAQDGRVLIDAQLHHLTAELGLLEVLHGVAELTALFGQVLADL